eukprot:13293422-Alexandrium_andersonii.AAC.1
MSASLVGSEMCIRDSRLLRARARRAVGGHGPPASREHGPSGRRSADPESCLLYTSDAADDM